MNKETKKSITYTILTIILVSVSLSYGNEDTSLVSYTTGLFAVITGFKAFLNIIDVVKGK